MDLDSLLDDSIKRHDNWKYHSNVEGTNALNDPIGDTDYYKIKGSLMFFLIVPQSPKFQSISLYDELSIKVTNQFGRNVETNCSRPWPVEKTNSGFS